MAKGSALRPLGNLSGIWCRCFLSPQLHSSLFTPKTAQPGPQRCGVLASRAAALQLPMSPATAFGRHQQGQDPWGRQGCRWQMRVSATQSSRNTRPGIPDTLESSSKGRIPFLQFQAGSWTRGKRQERVRAHTFRVPQKFPGCKGTSPGVFNCLASCWGCRRPLANTYSTPAPPLYQRALPRADLK